MAVTKLVLSKTGYRAFKYLTKEKDGSASQRVLHYDTIGIVPGDYDFMFDQFKSVWRKASKFNWVDQNGAVFGLDGGRAHNQAILTITSFSNEDFPRQPGGGYTDEQILRAMDIVRTTHEEMGYKQAVLVAQCDGDGGYLHIHGFVNAVDPITHKSLVNNARNYKKFRAVSDRVIQQFGLKPVEKDKANVLTKEERDKRAGKIPKDKVLFDEVLKDKIYDVLREGVSSRDEFIAKLAAKDVEVKINETKNGMDGVTYVMFDDTGEKKRNRRRKGSKLGTDFMMEHVDEIIEETRLKEAAEAEVFTKEDARALRSWMETLAKTPAGGANDMIRNIAQSKIDELKAKRDGVKRFADEENEEALREEKREAKKPEKKQTVKPDEIEPTPRRRRKPEERKGRRPEDEVHEVPDVKPLRDLSTSYINRAGEYISWLERLDDKKEKDEAAELAAETLEVASTEEPVMSEKERRKAEALAKAQANYRRIFDQLASNEGVTLTGGVPKEREEQQK